MIAGMLTKGTTLGPVGQKAAINAYGLTEVVPERGISSSAYKVSSTSESLVSSFFCPDAPPVHQQNCSRPVTAHYNVTNHAMIQVASKVASEGLASRATSIKAAHPLRQHSATSSLSPTPSLTPSSRSSGNFLVAAVDAAGATSQAPSDTAPTPVFAPSSKKPSSLPVPALTMSASAKAGDSESELHEVDPDMFVIKDLDSGKKYDIQKVSYVCTNCTLHNAYYDVNCHTVGNQLLVSRKSFAFSLTSGLVGCCFQDTSYAAPWQEALAHVRPTRTHCCCSICLPAQHALSAAGVHH